MLERLLLVVYAYGTGAGIRAVAAGEHGHSEHDLYYLRRWYVTRELVQTLAIQIANATFAVRDRAIWGAGSSAVASDSTHFGAWDQNIFTEWHSRYRSAGVLIYWHVEMKSVAIHSQLLRCTASEVAAMIDGAIHHGTEMDVRANYVDTHGQSVIGFGLTRLLGFELLPRIKRINHLRLYSGLGGPGNLSAVDAGNGAPGHRLGTDRPAVRRRDEIRGVDQEQVRGDRDDPAPVPPEQPAAPDLSGHAGDRPRTAHPVRLPLPAGPATATPDRRRPQRLRIVQRRQRRHLLRQGRRPARHPTRRPGTRRDVPESVAIVDHLPVL